MSTNNMGSSQNRISSSLNYVSIIEALKKDIRKTIEEENICGLAIALVNKEGIIWSEGFGYTDLTQEEKITADTLFSIQSMAKTFTATTFMILASKGLIDIDDPLRKYYPEFTINTKFGDKEEEIKKITFRRMLSYMAGFNHEAPIGNCFDCTPCTFEEHISSINHTWLRNKVGSEVAYSNLGSDITAYVLGKIRKKSFQEVVKEELFQPLGMKTATLDVHEAQQHIFSKGHFGNYEIPTVQVPMLGAAGVYISVNEQAKFVMLHLNEGKFNDKQLITHENFAEMYKSISEKKGIKNELRLGFYKQGSINNCEVYACEGGGYGYLTANIWVPKYGIAAIVFTNSMHHYGEGSKLAKKAIELMINEKDKPETITVASEKLQRLAGTYYALGKNMRNIVVEEGKLAVYDLYGGKQLLYPQSELEFLTENKTKFMFVIDDEDRVKTLDVLTKDSVFTLKYNEGPNDPLGPNEESWKPFLGIYEFYMNGLKYHIGLGVFNGYLHIYTFERIRLERYQENLYFTADGDSLILEKDRIIFKNNTFIKTELNTDKLLEECKSFKEKRLACTGILLEIASILYWSKGFDSAYEFIQKAIKVDTMYKEILFIIGIGLYGYRDIDNAKQCFHYLHMLDNEDTRAKEMLEKINEEQK
jgi:CubicO group peptidase (beta-lactamase class C family)